jgi:hypothetical protein
MLVSILTPIGTANADPTSGPEGTEPKSTAQTVSESPENARNKKPAEDEGGEKPDDSFIPSESISADSAISFPVDI